MMSEVNAIEKIFTWFANTMVAIKNKTEEEYELMKLYDELQEKLKQFGFDNEPSVSYDEYLTDTIISGYDYYKYYIIHETHKVSEVKSNKTYLVHIYLLKCSTPYEDKYSLRRILVEEVI